MEAYLCENGQLVVRANNGTEQYALKKWNKNFQGGDELSLLLVNPQEERGA